MTDIVERAKSALEDALADRPVTTDGARAGYVALAAAVALIPELSDELAETREILAATSDRERRAKAEIDSLRAQRDTANVAPRGGW